MKKWIALTLALACMLSLAGCKQETYLEIGQATSISIYSGLRGDSALVTDAEQIAYITDNLNAIVFDKGKRHGNSENGFAYSLHWYDEDRLVADLVVMDEYTVVYDDYYYNGMTADQEIDTDYLLTLLKAQYSEPIPDAPEDTWGVRMTVKDAISTGLTLVISHSGVEPEGELSTGTPYWVEVNRGGAWYQIPQVPPEDGIDRVWNDLAYIIPANGSWEQKVSLEWLYGELPAGTYRIGKEIALFRGIGDRDEQTYYAEFEIN